MTACRLLLSVFLLVMQILQVSSMIEHRFGTASGGTGPSPAPNEQITPLIIADPELVRLIADGWRVSPPGRSMSFRSRESNRGQLPDVAGPQAVAMIHNPNPTGPEDTVLVYGYPCMLGVAEPGRSESPDTVPGELPVLVLPRGYVTKVVTNLPTLRIEVPGLEDLGLGH